MRQTHRRRCDRIGPQSMNLADRVRSLEPVLRSEGRLIHLRPDLRTVFVGDTHGDLDATNRVLDRYFDAETTLVFLGDAVDRGPNSRENLERILLAKSESPDRVHLLMGNHEGWGIAEFSPAEFWMGLSPEEESALSSGLLFLPFAAWHPASLLATHGGLPDLRSLEEIASIAPGSPAWRDLVWGDWSEENEAPSFQPTTGRPTYGRDAFEKRTARLGIRALVRSHQPNAPTYLYGDRCLTLFTSSAYEGTVRRVAVLPPSHSVRTARDLALLEL
jgi:hypothetical protein